MQLKYTTLPPELTNLSDVRDPCRLVEWSLASSYAFTNSFWFLPGLRCFGTAPQSPLLSLLLWTLFKRAWFVLSDTVWMLIKQWGLAENILILGEDLRGGLVLYGYLLGIHLLFPALCFKPLWSIFIVLGMAPNTGKKNWYKTPARKYDWLSFRFIHSQSCHALWHCKSQHNISE